jgi:hypothetical protein
MTRPAASYVVERIRWTDPPRAFGGRRLPAAYPIGTSAMPGAAEAERRRLERKARKGVKPFAVGGPALFYQTGLDAGRLNDWLLDHGVTPADRPEAGHAPWLAWWDEYVDVP